MTAISTRGDGRDYAPGMFDTRAVEPADTRPHRQRLLRPHQTLEELSHPRERLGETGCFAAFLGEKIVGTALVFPASRSASVGLAPWRLVSLAVDPAVRRRGVGRRLVGMCLEHVRSHRGDEVWCHARTGALPFYEAMGFVAEGDQWVEGHTGPHVLMWRAV